MQDTNQPICEFVNVTQRRVNEFKEVLIKLFIPIRVKNHPRDLDLRAVSCRMVFLSYIYEEPAAQ